MLTLLKRIQPDCRREESITRDPICSRMPADERTHTGKYTKKKKKNALLLSISLALMWVHCCSQSSQLLSQPSLFARREFSPLEERVRDVEEDRKASVSCQSSSSHTSSQPSADGEVPSSCFVTAVGKVISSSWYFVSAPSCRWIWARHVIHPHTTAIAGSCR